MVRRSLRSKSLRKIYVKTTSGTKIHFKKRPGALPKCGCCKTTLIGIKKRFSYKNKSINKCNKKVNRPYGGNLCSQCMRVEMKRRVGE